MVPNSLWKGILLLSVVIFGFIKSILSRRTRTSLRFDLLRLRARLLHQIGRRNLIPPAPKLHFGCGKRAIPGWTNVDVVGSPFDIDLAARLPWKDNVFDVIVAQQVIEHLSLEHELTPLMNEIVRVARPGCEIWLSTPDLEKVCRGYLEDGGRSLRLDRITREEPIWSEGMPDSHFINLLFHQGNEHKNLFDLKLLTWVLESHGFGDVRRTNETAFRERFPEFPKRNDDFVGIYVRAEKPKY